MKTKKQKTTQQQQQPRRILTQKELKQLADEIGVRDDWHEPDEQGVTVRVKGKIFDNAGFWPAARNEAITEKYVVIFQNGKEVGHVNLASLFAMACGNPMEQTPAQRAATLNLVRKSDGTNPMEQTPVHVNHCCRLHGCKYGDDPGCPVVMGHAIQSGPCEDCRSA